MQVAKTQSRTVRGISLVTLACALAGSGCGGAARSTTDASVSADLAVAPGPSVGYLCTDARADAWALPLTKTTASGALKVTLLSSSADVPVIGDSKTTWTIAVADAATGAPVAGAAVSVLPYMPDHHHGTSVKAAVSDLGGGKYAVAPLYFFMAGYWTVTVSVGADAPAADAGSADSVVFSVCLTDVPPA